MSSMSVTFHIRHSVFLSFVMLVLIKIVEAPLEASSACNRKRAFPISVLAVAGAPKYPSLPHVRKRK